MEKVIQFDGINVPVTWNEKLQSGTIIHVETDDPGLAMICVELLLDELELRHLWYESSFPGYPQYQEIELICATEDDWDGWSRQYLLAVANAIDNKKLN